MNATIERTLSDINDEFTVRLDDLEHSLPTIPAKALSVTRAGARRVNDVVAATYCRTASHVATVGESIGLAARTTSGQAEAQARRTADSVSTGAKTVAGQAEAQARRVGDSITTGAKTVAGQARAQSTRAADTVSNAAKTVAGQATDSARRAAETARDEVEDGLDEARVALESDELATLTKAELYERAQDLDIDGRSGMSKAELISALQQASTS